VPAEFEQIGSCSNHWRPRRHACGPLNSAAEDSTVLFRVREDWADWDGSESTVDCYRIHMNEVIDIILNSCSSIIPSIAVLRSWLTFLTPVSSDNLIFTASCCTRRTGNYGRPDRDICRIRASNIINTIVTNHRAVIPNTVRNGKH